jgi:hypothetical protein
MTARYRNLAIVAATVTVLIAPGCRDQRLSEENDRLRARVLDLETEIRALRQRNEELAVAVERVADASDGLSADALAATPGLVELKIGRLSHSDDEDGDGIAETLVLYLNPRDGRSRFLQIVGTLSVHAAVLPPDADAITIGRRTLDPIELRDAYRSGVTGTHYTVELPIESGNGDNEASLPNSAIVRVEFTDARTGAVHAAERAIPLVR